ncbi:MAG: NAD(P)-dependent oxidoreductase [Geminicoccaceae bacterium]|nr:NAD(P)-dependent oxidoreductase [Geminicoccaceae bacterium]
MERETIGLVGLGFVGTRIARRLLAAGRSLCVLDRDRAKIEALRDLESVTTAPDLGVLQQRATTLVSCLPSEKAVEELAAALERKGTLLLDTSTIRPSTARRLHAALARRGIGYVEAPLLRAEREQEEPEFVLLASGAPADLDRARPLLSLLAERIFVAGPIGAASRFALALGALRLVALVARAEAMTLVAADGGDLDAFVALAGELSALPGGRAAWERLRRGRPQPAIRLRIAAKDASLAAAFAEELGLDLPLFRRTAELLRAALAEGLGELDAGAVARALERESGVRITAEPEG